MGVNLFEGGKAERVAQALEALADGVEFLQGPVGTTFTPAVDENGVISWTNDGGKTNPTSVSIKGPKGDTGDPAPAEDVTTAVDAYLEENFTNPDSPPLDRTLASSSSAAPADLVGDLKSAIESIGYDIKTVSESIANPNIVYPYDGAVNAIFDGNTDKVGIVAVNGKNFMPKIDSQTVYGITATQDDDGTIHLNGTTTASLQILWDCVIPVKGKTLAVQLNNNFVDSNVALIFLDENGSRKITFGATELNRKYSWSNQTNDYFGVGIRISSDVGTTYNDVTLKPMVCIDGAYNTYEVPSAIFDITTGESANLSDVDSGMLCYATKTGVISYSKQVPKYVSELADKTWFCLGDSITYNSGNYHEIIAESDGVIPTNGGVAGTGYMRTVGSQGNFATRSANMNTVYDIVTVMGSINDINEIANIGTATDTGTATIGGCINTTIDNIYASGNYHLGLISPIPSGTYNGNPKNGENTHVARIVALEAEICRLRGVPFLDLFHSSNMQPWDSTFASLYMNDDTHPNAAGYKIFSNAIKQFIKSL